MVPTLDELIDQMKASGYLRSGEVEQALREVRREDFIPVNKKEWAYLDRPLEIEKGQTISQPSTVVVMLEALKVGPGQKILEIGTGSGWQAGLLSKLVGKEGQVFTMERIHSLHESSKLKLKNYANVFVVLGDGTLGLPKQAPFDRIIVTAAAPEIPDPLREQLKVGGVMVIPLGDKYTQQVQIITKPREGVIERKALGLFAFVPLIGKHGFK